MGMATCNTLDRVAASLGQLDEVDIDFEPCLDVPNGGVLFALPALLTSGLLRYTSKHFQLPKGFYGIKSIFLVLSFMALVRLKSIESLRYNPPGEWGKLLGLDRVPEVRTLRRKVAILSEQGDPEQWSAELCREWMGSADADCIGAFYVDGHVRVYHGSQTKLPRHYVPRQKLCLRATTDYWVNAMDGQPFFKVEKTVDPGLLKVLSEDIVPCLLQEVPHQPSAEELKANPLRHRFTLVFDREAYSPEFMLKMRKQHIACLTYHKFPLDNWPEREFISRHVTLASGNIVSIKLAERGSFIGNQIWVREIRKLTERGHQVSIIATDYQSDLTAVAVFMFARWSQENFFKYMREHYSLDRLIDYSLDEIPATTKLVNPAYRDLEALIRSKNGMLTKLLATFGAINLEHPIEKKRIEEFQRIKAKLLEQLSQLQEEIIELKEKRKVTDHHITIAELPKEQQFKKLSSQSKHFIDTIKMIAYRAETAMAHILREKISREDDVRTLLRAIYSAEADLVPNAQDQTLTITLHHIANQYSTRAIKHLAEEINATETLFPGTSMRLIYKMVS